MRRFLTVAGNTCGAASVSLRQRGSGTPSYSSSWGSATSSGTSSGCNRHSRRGAAATASGRSPLIFVLDLDETLVRVACEGVHRTRQIDKVDFTVNVSVGTGAKQQVFNCGVGLRPGLDRFFEWIKDRRKCGLIEGPWIFTTSTRVYTNAILAKLDPNGDIFGQDGARVLARNSCEAAVLPGFFLKDLSRVPVEEAPLGEDNKGFRRKLLLDNNPVSHVLNPGHSVLCRDWLGTSTNDSELARVQDLIDEVIFDARTSAAEGSSLIDYAAALGRTQGHSSFRSRLEGLKGQLDAPWDNKDKAILRESLKAVQNEANDMKLELLGAAP